MRERAITDPTNNFASAGRPASTKSLPSTFDSGGQSQRDCAAQPRVAVLGYPGTRIVIGPNPNGVAASDAYRRNVALMYTATGRRNPFRVAINDRHRTDARPVPRIAEYGNPGL